MKFENELAQHAFDSIIDKSEEVKKELTSSTLNYNEIQQFMFDSYIRAIEVASQIEIDLVKAKSSGVIPRLDLGNCF
jgi:hypothetical protein